MLPTRKHIRSASWSLGDTHTDWRPRPRPMRSLEVGNGHVLILTENWKSSMKSWALTAQCCDPNPQEADTSRSWVQAQPGLHSETLSQQKQRQKIILSRETFPHQIICWCWSMVYIETGELIFSLYFAFSSEVVPCFQRWLPSVFMTCGIEHIWCVSGHCVLSGALTAPPVTREAYTSCPWVLLTDSHSSS